MTTREPSHRGTWLAVFLLSLGLLLYELCLTRVLSVLFYYHTAFLAISVAMLGIGAGGLWVQLHPHWFREREGPILTISALSMCLLPILFPVLHLDLEQLDSVLGGPFLLAVGITVVAILIPFLGGGMVLAMTFQRHRERLPRLYASDLVGAAAGTLLLVPTMSLLGGPAALFASGTFVALAGIVLVPRWRRYLAGALLALVGMIAVQLVTGQPAIEVDLGRDSSDKTKPTVLYKRWNAFSRVLALKHRGWSRGLSDARRKELQGKLPSQIEAVIDINAYAPLVSFDGDLTKVGHLAEIVSNIGHHLLPKGRRIGIIGPGGGKDVLGALLFEPEQVTGIEINPILVEDLVRGRFSKFTGDIYRHPKVRIHVGDGRAVLRQLDQRFDLIIANSVITWAAHSAGAMNLSEHSLFTVESCKLYLSRLRPGGILSMSLWDEDHHGIPIRWINTCAAAAAQHGKGPLTKRVAVVGNPWDDRYFFSSILISRSPFTDEQIKILDQASKAFGFKVIYAPGRGKANHANIRNYFKNPRRFVEGFKLDVSPATDDRPFFLFTLRSSQALRFWDPDNRTENMAYFSLVVSLVIVFFLVLLALLLPLVWIRWIRRDSSGLNTRELTYFAALGAAFMFVEIPLVQRLSLVLGHPTYALTVGLGGLLVWSGVGSRWLGRWAIREERRLRWILAAMLVLLAGFWALLNALIPILGAAPAAVRILSVFFLMAPVGMLMGTPMPTGLDFVGRHEGAPIPWAWGVNGATSVLASVASVVVAVFAGFTVAFSIGAACYLLALATTPRKTV